MRCDFITIFPRFYEGFFKEGLIAKGVERGLLEVAVHNLRDYADDRHASVDDVPYGGGTGMVFKPEPIFRAVRDITTRFRSEPKVILPSAQGVLLNQEIAKKLSFEKHLIFLCPRYKGIDERVAEHLVDCEISIGDYVIHSGDAGAWVIFEALARHIPGLVGNEESVVTDSFSAPSDISHKQNGVFEGPLYTRPQEFEGMRVPEILLSGNHAAIAKWRREKAIEKTLKVRPELLSDEANLSDVKDAELTKLAEKAKKDNNI